MTKQYTHPMTRSQHLRSVEVLLASPVPPVTITVGGGGNAGSGR